MHTPIFQVDAFASEPFSGNPAAVCVLQKHADPHWMQRVAAEMNLSETAFVVPLRESFGLRWFTPRTEVALCGHATLAAAHVLWETGRRRSWPIRFETLSGDLVATAADGRIHLDFPTDAPQPTRALAGLDEALGAAPVWLGKGREYLLVELADEQTVRDLRPDYLRLVGLVPVGVCVTARSRSPDFDFVSRFFAPGVGIDEDPVTGSAHCLLGPFWAERVGKSELVGFQASPRGGVVQVRLAGDRTILGGRAVTIFEGRLRIPLAVADPRDQGVAGHSGGGRK